MKNRLIKTLLFFSLITNFIIGGKLLLTSKNQKSTKTNKVTVKRVIDGDTFITEKGEYIRLAGIDAPEYPQQCLSLEAKEKLTQLINGQEVETEFVKKDKFGRTLAFVFKDGLLLDRVLLTEGFGQALEEIESPYQAELIKAENEAQKLGRGIWSSLCQPPENCRIKGNYRRDKETKIYHLPECYNYEKIVVNEKEGDRWFCTEEEAQKAGFSKSKDCP